MRGGDVARTVAVCAIVATVVLSAVALALPGRSAALSRPELLSLTPSTEQPAAFDLTWTNLSIPNDQQPGPRVNGNMVYDSAAREVVLFGGEYANETLSRDIYLNDTWTFADGKWTNITPTVSPSPRTGAGMAYDPAQNDIVLFGGRGQQRQDLNDTWVWSGGTWTNITSEIVGPSPPEGFWFSMAYDAQTEAMLLFGGVNETASGISTEYTNATWSFLGDQWTELSPTNVPPVRHAQQMIWDGAENEMVMFGGGSPALPLNDTWTYYNGDWTNLSLPLEPGPRGGYGLAYDSNVNRVVLYGGSPGGPVDFYSTWLFDGVAWTEYNTTAEPVNPQATYGQFVYDAAANQVIDLNEPIALGPVSTWALNISNAAIGPSPLSVTLTATPSSITLGGETNLSAVPSGGTPPIRYVYTNLPAGCVSANVPTLACTPTATGSFRVTVTVTDDLGNTAEANASLTVSAGTTSPPASSSGSSSYWIWAVLAVVIIAVLLAIVLLARRRRPPPTPYTPGGPPVPPPTPPPPPGN